MSAWPVWGCLHFCGMWMALSIPASAWLYSDWDPLSRLHLFKISSFLSHSWENLRDSWQRGMLPWKSHCLYISFHWPYQQPLTQVYEKQSTFPFGHWKTWGWIMSCLWSAGNASYIFHDVLTTLFTIMTKKCWIKSEIKYKYFIKCLHWTCLSIQPHFLLSHGDLVFYSHYNELHAVS